MPSNVFTADPILCIPIRLDIFFPLPTTVFKNIEIAFKSVDYIKHIALFDALFAAIRNT